MLGFHKFIFPYKVYVVTCKFVHRYFPNFSFAVIGYNICKRMKLADCSLIEIFWRIPTS